MTHITLEETDVRKLSFYLAMEEYVARHVDVSDAFFIWQVRPSVIFGRNQLIENEVNVDYCRRHGVEMYRRKSGGGCVYADLSNMMLAYITRSDSVQFTYNQYVTLVVAALRRMGIPATANGRNDILIEGRKVSGNAFYHLPGRSIVHGTMLYDTDMSNMVNCITPDDEKLRSKGVASVRQHIALLKDYTRLSLADIRREIIAFVCRDELRLTAADVRRIEEMEQEYLSPEFIYGNNPRYTLVRKKRMEGVGTVEVRMELRHNVIRDIDLKGDYFLLGDVDSLCKSLRGAERTREGVGKVLAPRTEDVIMNLNRNDLITLITE